MEEIINKSKKSNQSTVWDEKVDKRLAEIKKVANKNGNHMIFVLTSEDFKNKKGSSAKMTGMMVSHMFSLTRGIELFLDSVPQEAVQVVMMKKALGGIGKILSKSKHK
jgi:hypothetical protein